MAMTPTNDSITSRRSRWSAHAFARDHLRRGAGRNQRVKAGDRAAGDGDEAERENFAGEDGAGAVDEARERGHLQRRAHEQDADGERAIDAELHESAEIIARSEQQPDRQRAGEKP